MERFVVKLTNKFGLPEPVVRALSFDNYSKGRADYSVTQLLDSPRVRALQWRYDNEIVRDVTDNFFSLLGRACHQILEWGGVKTDGATAEERLFLTVEVDGVPITISGSMDLQEASEEQVVISDYKVTSVLSATMDKASWEQQLNLYAYLVKMTKGKGVLGLQIIVFLRDWRKSVAERDRAYPQSPILVLPIRQWHMDVAEQFLRERIRLHMKAGDDVLSGDMPAPCTPEERWEGDASFAVMKPGGKRAVKVFDNEDDAIAHVERANAADLVVERRGGEPRRCKGNWCGVAEFCDYGRSVRDEEF